MLDLSAAICEALVDVGVDDADNIVDTQLSTVRQNDRFYSYRNEDGTCGRHSCDRRDAMRKIVSVLSAAVLTLTLCACSSDLLPLPLPSPAPRPAFLSPRLRQRALRRRPASTYSFPVWALPLASRPSAPARPISPAPLRGLNADERDAGLTPIVIAHDGIAVIVNDDNPVDNLRPSSSTISMPARSPTGRKSAEGPEDSGHQPRQASGTREAFHHRDGRHAVRSPLGCSFWYGPGTRCRVPLA